jgi:Mce-associated membrane protein
VPPQRRRPATPPPRRPKVAGLNRPAATPEPEVADTPDLDVPVIGEAEPTPRPTPKQRDTGTVTDEPAPRVRPSRRRRAQDPAPATEESTEPTESTESTDSADSTEPVESNADKGSVTGTIDETDTDESVGDPVEADRQQPKFLLPMVFVVVALLLGGLAWFFASKAADARVGSGNAALVDVNGSKDVVGAAQQAVTSVLSYKYDDMAKAKERAQVYLSGEAVDQYAKSMDALAGQIQQQKLQVTVNPVSVGVVRLQGDDARVLVFADQIGVRGDQQNQPSGGPTQFAMDMHRADGKWKIVKLDFFDGR